MSLLNDALRRAGESSRRRGRAASPFNALQPVDRLDRGGAGLKWVGFFLLLSFGAAVWFLWRAGLPEGEPAAAEPARIRAPEPPPPIAAVEPPARVKPDPPPPEPPLPLTEPSKIRVSTNLLLRTSTGSVQAPPPPTVGPFPEVRLQSIIFRPEKPIAMINGQTVGPGDRVDGLSVGEIRSNSVVVVWGEERREVRLREF